MNIRCDDDPALSDLERIDKIQPFSSADTPPPSNSLASAFYLVLSSRQALEILQEGMRTTGPTPPPAAITKLSYLAFARSKRWP